MEVTISTLLEGKPTVIKNIEYLATKEYVTPFLNEMKKFTNRFIVNVELPKQLTVTNDNKDITYNKVWIQAIMPDKCNVAGYNEVYGFIYALDIRTPVYKVYRAYMDPETMNLCVFDKNWIQTQELKPEEVPQINLTNLMQMSFDIEQRIKTMQNTFISSDIEECHSLLGRLIEGSLLFEYKDLVGKIKLSPTDVIKSYENIYHNTTSKYYIKDTEECTVLNYYSSLCSQITESKDIINRWEKTILTGILLKLINYESD